MQWFRTLPHVIRILVALFLVAQFAGVVPSPLAQAHAVSATAGEHAAHHHADGQGHDGCAHIDHGACGDHADYCCALHAFFAGILPPAAAIEITGIAAETLRPGVSDVVVGVHPARLDRPPRPLS
jgi:hypothetical protein